MTLVRAQKEGGMRRKGLKKYFKERLGRSENHGKALEVGQALWEGLKQGRRN